MSDEKVWYESKTIWGALIAIFASIINGLGFDLDTVSQSQLADSVIQLIGAIGAILAIYGRLNATDVIR